MLVDEIMTYYTSLADAIYSGNYERVGSLLQQELLQDQAVRNMFEQLEELDKSLVCLAASCGNSDILKRLVAYGFNANGRDSRRKTPLMLSAELGNTANVKILLDSGCDADARDDENNNAIMHILKSWLVNGATHKICTALSYLILEGCSLDAENFDGEFALDIAMKSGVQPAVIKLLLDGGANPNSVSPLGFTPLTSLTWYSWFCSKDYANELFKNGASANISRVSPLPGTTRDYAHGCELFSLLIENGAEIDGCHPKIGSTLLASAIFGRPYIAKCAVKLNARINVSDTSTIPLSYQIKPIYKDNDALEMVFAAGEDYLYFNNIAPEIQRTMPPEIRDFHQDSTLQNLARKFIRNYLRVRYPNVNLFRVVPNVGLPKLLQSYLLFNQSIED